MNDLILEKILVAVDFSEHSNTALEQALLLAADAPSAELILLWVDTRAQSLEILGGEVLSPETHDLEPPSELHSEVKEKLDALAQRVTERGLRVETRIERGYADEVISAVAREIGAALVVVGTRGLTGFKRLLLGSVAEKVVRTSFNNVLVVRGAAAKYSRILVAADFSPASDHALQVAMSLAAPGAVIDIVHAWQYPPGTRGLLTPDPPDGPLANLRKALLQRIQKLGDSVVHRYHGPGRTLKFETIFGAAAKVLHERLESGDYQLVAMGTHGHRGFRRFLLGSVAEATVRHAPCSALVTHNVAPDED